MKILIIDDAIELNNTISEILSNHNYEVESAYDGKSGLRMALEKEYDIILLDIMLPQLNGYDVLKKLRNAGRDVPVILITARDDIDDKIDGLELGADDYLSKPFNINELIVRIKAVARRSKKSTADDSLIYYADVALNTDAGEIIKEQSAISINETECEIIKYLINHSEVIVPEKNLIKKTGLRPEEKEKLNLYINHLRDLLNILKSKIKIIYIRDCGYKLC